MTATGLDTNIDNNDLNPTPSWLTLLARMLLAEPIFVPDSATSADACAISALASCALLAVSSISSAIFFLCCADKNFLASACSRIAVVCSFVNTVFDVIASLPDICSIKASACSFRNPWRTSCLESSLAFTPSVALTIWAFINKSAWSASLTYLLVKTYLACSSFNPLIALVYAVTTVAFLESNRIPDNESLAIATLFISLNHVLNIILLKFTVVDTVFKCIVEIRLLFMFIVIK